MTMVNVSPIVNRQLPHASNPLIHHNIGMDTARLFARIHELMAKAGHPSIRAVSLAAGLQADFLRDVKSGRNRQPSVEKLAKVATALGTTVDDLLAAGGIDQVTAVGRTPRIMFSKVVGEVEAGAWREALEWPDDRQFEIPLLKIAKYPDARTYGLRLAGDSMDRFYPLPNTIVICIPFLDIERGPLPGEVVIAQRQRHDLFEASCKVFAQSADAAYLEPRSTNPAHQRLRLARSKAELDAARLRRESVAVLDGAMEAPRDTDIINITGLVVGAYVEQT